MRFAILILEEGASKFNVIQRSCNRSLCLRIDVRFHARHAIIGHLLGKVLENNGVTLHKANCKWIIADRGDSTYSI